MNRNDAPGQPIQKTHHRLRRGMRQGHEDVVDLVSLHYRFRFAHRAQAFETGESRVIAVAQIPDDTEAELIAMLFHALQDGPGEIAIAGDEHAIEILAGAMATLDDEPHQHAAED